jgi:hypothetical protein
MTFFHLLCLWRLHGIPDAGVAPPGEVALVIIPRDCGGGGSELLSHVSRSHGLIVIELQLLMVVDLVQGLLLVVGVHDCEG